MNDPRKNARDIFPPTGPELNAKHWTTEAPLRMLMNNLHPDVAENPHELVVYGGIGRATRTWEDFDRICASLKDLEENETLLVQSGRPVGVFRTHADAPAGLAAWAVPSRSRPSLPGPAALPLNAMKPGSISASAPAMSTKKPPALMKLWR